MSVRIKPNAVRIPHFKFGAKGLIVEKHPWILIFSIPLVFKLPHALHQSRKFGVANEADQSRTRF